MQPERGEDDCGTKAGDADLEQGVGQRVRRAEYLDTQSHQDDAEEAGDQIGKTPHELALVPALEAQLADALRSAHGIAIATAGGREADHKFDRLRSAMFLLHPGDFANDT